jgi:hypothetical protein
MQPDSGRTRRRHLNYPNVMSTLAVFLALGGTAAALSGSNTVFSDDIVNDQVRSADVRDDTLAAGGLTAPDLRAGSVGPSEVRNNSLGGGDIADGTLGSIDIANGNLIDADIELNSLTGASIDESTLDQVPSALVGGLGRQGAELDVCDPESNEFVFCKNSQLFNVPPGGARALVLARLSGASGSGSGRCRLGTSSIGVMPDTDQIVSGLENTTLVGITDPLPPGPTDFAVDCNETGGEMIYGELAVSALLISPS